jgi:hypothetical protein
MFQRALFVVGIVALVVACQADTDPASTAPSADPATGAEPPAPGASDAPSMDDQPAGPDALVSQRDPTVVDTHVVDMRFSNSGDAERNILGAATDTFASDTPTVFAEVQTSGTAPEYTLYAKWLAPDGSVLSDYGMRQEGGGNQRAVISLGKPDGWTPGRYRVEIAINSQDPKAYSFTVR